MEIINLLQKEMEKEAIVTRKMLARVPAEKFGWQPHTKSMTLMALATHITELPGWVAMALHTDGLDFATVPYEPKTVKSTDELLDFFEEKMAEGRDALANAEINKLGDEWVLRNGNEVLSIGSKYDMIRIAFSQIIHHRAQLGVYLRLLDIPIPGSYGPSADEMGS